VIVEEWEDKGDLFLDKTRGGERLAATV